MTEFDNPETNSRTNVLILTEDAVYGDLLKYGLKAWGYSVLVKEAGADSRSLVDESKPDVLILDLFMAINDGFKLLHYVRGSELKDMPVMVLITSDDRAVAVEAMVAGANDVLLKPLPFPMILASLKNVLGVPAPAEGTKGQPELTGGN